MDTDESQVREFEVRLRQIGECIFRRERRRARLKVVMGPHFRRKLQAYLLCGGPFAWAKGSGYRLQGDMFIADVEVIDNPTWEGFLVTVVAGRRRDARRSLE